VAAARGRHDAAVPPPRGLGPAAARGCASRPGYDGGCGCHAACAAAPASDMHGKFYVKCKYVRGVGCMGVGCRFNKSTYVGVHGVGCTSDTSMFVGVHGGGLFVK